MSRRKEITTADLNRALRRSFNDARRQNKALGLETLYKKDGYLVSLDASGQEHKIIKLEGKKRTSPPKVITFD